MPTDPIAAALKAAAEAMLDHPLHYRESTTVEERRRVSRAIVAFLRALPEDWEPRGCPLPGACSVARIMADAVERAGAEGRE